MRARTLLALSVFMLAGCSPTCSSTARPASSPQAAISPASSLPSADASCLAEATSRSLNSNTGTSFTLVNRTSVSLTLFWLSFQGQRVKYQDVPAGQTRNQGTFVTHPWVVADPSGRCIRLFQVPSATPIQVTIG